MQKTIAEQASTLYEMNHGAQSLDIFIQNSVFSHDFNPSMVTGNGIMDGMPITGFERIHDKILRLNLAHSPLAGEGTLTFSAHAAKGAQEDFIVQVKAKRPEVRMAETVQVNAKDPVISFMTNISLSAPPALAFCLGGALEGLAVSSFSWTTSGGTIELKGTPKRGAATLSAMGAFESSCQFEVVVVDPNETFPDIVREQDAGDLAAPPLYNRGLDGEVYTGSADQVTDMAENAGKTADAMAALSDVSAAISIISGTFNIIKTLDSLFNWGIFPDPNEKFNAEFGKINTKLDMLDQKMTDINDGVKRTQELIISKFNALEYSLTENLMGPEREFLKSFLDQYNRIFTKLDGPIRDEALLNLLNLVGKEATTEARHVIYSINYLISCLDPYDSGGVNTSSLTYKYYLKVMTDTPFYHNCAQMFMAYTRKWTAEIVRYSIIAGAVFNHNILFYPGYKALFEDEMLCLAKKIKTASDNIGQFFAEKGRLQFSALDNLAAVGFVRDDLNRVPYEKKANGVLLVSSRDGNQFVFDNIGNTVAWEAPYPGSTFLKVLSKTGEKCVNTKAGSTFDRDFFVGPNSLFAIYGAGLSLNDFMSKYINTDAVRWLRPDEIIIETYPSKGKVSGREYEEALFAVAKETAYVTHIRTSDFCMGDKKNTYARVFKLKDPYTYLPSPKHTYIAHAHFTLAKTLEAATKALSKIAGSTPIVLETAHKSFDKRALKGFLGFTTSKNVKDAITDMVIYSTDTNPPPETLTIKGHPYKRFDMDLNAPDTPQKGYKWLYYTRDLDVDFPLHRIMTVPGYEGSNWWPIGSEKGEKASISSAGTSIPYYLYCHRSI